MLPIPPGVRVRLAPGVTDMRKGFPGLSLLVQETLKRDPHAGHLFVFRGRRGDYLKIIWHFLRRAIASPLERGGQGACLFAKRPERGRQHSSRRSR